MLVLFIFKNLKKKQNIKKMLITNNILSIFIDYTNVYSEGDFQHVQIDEITMDHKGKYSVEAFNEHGVVKSNFTVIVDHGLERYMPPFFTRNEVIYVKP